MRRHRVFTERAELITDYSTNSRPSQTVTEILWYMPNVKYDSSADKRHE